MILIFSRMFFEEITMDDNPKIKKRLPREIWVKCCLSCLLCSCVQSYIVVVQQGLPFQLLGCELQRLYGWALWTLFVCWR
jgi:hypothetical protein